MSSEESPIGWQLHFKELVQGILGEGHRGAQSLSKPLGRGLKTVDDRGKNASILKGRMRLSLEVTLKNTPTDKA